MSTQEIFSRIPLIIDEIGAVEKSRRGEGIAYSFRGIDDIYQVLQPLLAKHKVSIWPEVLEERQEAFTNAKGTQMQQSVVKMKFTFAAPDGSTASAVTLGESFDSSDKASIKAQSMAFKTMACQVFCIPTKEKKDTEEDDYERGQPSNNSTAQADAQSLAKAGIIKPNGFRGVKTV